MSKPVAEFDLSCGSDSRFFYRVQFWATTKEMISAIGTLRGFSAVDDEDARAMCLRYVKELVTGEGKGASVQKTGELGTIFFTRWDAGPEVVVHELTHAAIGWAKRARVNPLKVPARSNRRVADQEEKFAETFQYMFEEFYRQAQKAFGLQEGKAA
jgi:hypothetical protein